MKTLKVIATALCCIIIPASIVGALLLGRHLHTTQGEDFAVISATLTIIIISVTAVYFMWREHFDN